MRIELIYQHKSLISIVVNVKNNQQQQSTQKLSSKVKSHIAKSRGESLLSDKKT
jgi:hypothetical protein